MQKAKKIYQVILKKKIILCCAPTKLERCLVIKNIKSNPKHLFAIQRQNQEEE
jgi:hypothetical protein